ncbi:MAG: bifunctional methylenetetrahydrofolate dehydrogenase/methenyltetrahydrofolate cyclohydrolase FolD [bacterium]|mgnify:FL=1|jgi:methylenetetrahydrofolate dehydrogenase (NADP+)/methenyltetrahydrofolate cyclohydrolase|nr:MAG: bifunctional methylenetetrahydrofolate dehydrogenase/methenyltetrahydrofolate cyclohydrolase FolD [bacterium]
MARILSGTELSSTMRAEIADEAARFQRETGVRPGLATILVGDDPASQIYVRMKGRAADAAGFYSRSIVLPGDTSHQRLLGVIDGLNVDPEIHGILVQLPLPKQIRTDEVLLRIDPAKDVDAFHPMNMGRLASGDREVLAPCTPAGIVELLLRNGYDPAGKRVVIVGRSNIVGRPLALLLLRTGRGGDATVTVAHSRTPDLAAVTREADILVAAAGRAELIRRDMVKPGAIVIDVGVNRVADPSSEKGYRVVGDVAFDEVAEIAEAITPVPGGVGPMTITMLLRNTLEAARRLTARSTEAQTAVSPHG